jgi:predicted metal-dependent peptidase
MTGTRLPSGPQPVTPLAAGIPVDRDETEAIALERLEKARLDILLDQPYFASALLQLPIRGTWDPAIRNAVVTDGKRVVFRHDLVAALLRPQVRVLVLHALAHVLLDHPRRGGSRAWPLWTVACDVAVDELLAMLGDFSLDEWRTGCDAANTRSAEAIYADLERTARDDPSADSRVDSSADLRAESGATRPMPAPTTTDGLLPTVPPDAMDDAERAEREAFLRAAGDAEVPSAAEFEALRDAFRYEVEKASLGVGRESGNSSSEIAASRAAVLPWRHELARFLCEPIDRGWSFARPNRKHLWRGIFLPGMVPVEGGRFVVAIDTSGSMSDAVLSQVLAEIDMLRRSVACELVIVQFDATIQKVVECSTFAGPVESGWSIDEMRCYGRGGTDLRLPFQWTEEARREGRAVSALIVCTDGYGPLPTEQPDGLPVLFMLTPHHAAPSFGRHLVLPNRL